MALNVYPKWVREHPQFALELLAEIRYWLVSGRDLDDEQRRYLADAIGKILKGVPPKRALYLTQIRKSGPRLHTQRNMHIYERVEQERKGGRSLRRAYEIAAVGTSKGKGSEALSPKAVEKIYLAIRQIMSRPRRMPTLSRIEK